jgi:hypothetical protein
MNRLVAALFMAAAASAAFLLAGCPLLDDNLFSSSPASYPNVQYRDGKYYPAPGYTWIAPNDEDDKRVTWQPNKEHSDHKHVLASTTEGNWHPAPGYKWVTQTAGDLRVAWAPGVEHPDFKHTLAAATTDQWHPVDGYDWVNPSTAGDLRCVWKPGKAYPGQPHVVASETEGRWKPAAGYKWANVTETDLTVEWAPGKRHPEQPNIVAGVAEGDWRPSPGYDWVTDDKNDLRVVWKPGRVHPDDPNRVAAPEEGHWILHVAAAAPAPTFGQRWAVVIGISQYKYAGPGLKNLSYADDDAKAFAAFLQTPEGGGFPAKNVRLLTDENATKAAIADALFEFLKHTVKEDLVVIFFSCHGAPDPDKPANLYLVAHDSNPAKIASTGFPMWDLNTALQRTIGAERVIVLADACHSAGVAEGVKGVKVGSHFDRYYDELAKSKPGRCVFTSSEGYESSLESDRWGGGHGVFTWALLEGLKGAADRDGDGLVKLGELLDYVDVTVRRETANEQHPTHAGSQFDRNLPMAVVK